MSLKPNPLELENQVRLLAQQRDTYMQITEELKENERKYRTIFENIADSYLEIDLKGNFLFFNQAFCKLLGYPREELQGRNNQDFLDEENARIVFDIFTGVYQSKQSVMGATWEMIRKDGSKRRVETSVSLVRDAKGEIIGFRGIGRDVTAQKETERILALNEARFRDISLSMADWIWEVNRDGTYTFTAGNVKKVLGYAPEEMLGKTPMDFMPDDEAGKIKKSLETIFAQRRPIVDLKNWCLKKDGTRVCMLTNGVPILGLKGELLGYRGVDKDITRDLMVEEKLKKSLENTETIINNLPIGVMIVGKDHIVRRINNAALKMTGHDSDETIVGHTCHQSICPSEKGHCHLKELGHQVDQSEKIIIHKDGRHIPVFKTALEVELGDSEVILEAFMDISSIKKAEKKIRESEARLRTVMETIVDPVAVFNTLGQATYVNPAFTEVFGWTTEELKDPACPFIPETLLPEIRHAIRKVLGGGHINGLETRRNTKTGRTIDVRLGAALLQNASGESNGIVANFQDITREKQAKKELKQINRELEKAIEHAHTLTQRAEMASAAKSEFLANMSHEIRTPMNGIIGMTDLVLGTPLTGEQREYLEMAQMSANALLGLLNDILDVSKIEAGKMELETIEFNLRITLENAVNTLALKAHEKGLELVCHIRPDVPTALMGDPGRLRQIIVNLAGNAIKFTDKGEVVIRVEKEKETPSTATLKFTVSDTGIGIPRDTLGSIFHSFKQADGSATRKYGGTGLGLSISRQLVNLMGGTIHAESPNPFEPDSPQPHLYRGSSEGGPGSIFHFTAVFELNRSEETPSLRLNRQDLAGLPTLIVDDNATNRFLLQEMLTTWGLSPTSAADGREALSLAAKAFESQKPFRLALLDMQMPEIDGFQLARKIKDAPLGEQMKMIMISSMGEKEDSRRCREAGISGYLSKPVKQSELLNTILITMGLQEGEAATVVTRHTVCDLQQRLNILLAEDNRVNQVLAVNLLKTKGHQVTLAVNGGEAVAAYQRGDFDLILMDVQMPEMDGFEATRIIRNLSEKGARIPIIAMTAHAMKGDQEKCLEAGMNAYVAKPINPATLFETVDRVLGDAESTGKPFVPKTFDMATAMENVLGDPGLFREITDIFLKELPANLDELRKAVLKKDGPAIERLAHSLKGSVGNFGAAAAHDNAQRLEIQGKEHRFELAEDEAATLETSLHDLAHELTLTLKGMPHENHDCRR
ncbi:PAS domain S-box protein [Desulfoluna spongiiphila]|uniref:Sensory/regulatory protein RpfC n=1 Tax=Desulfoluna spongiiphila TaxID=419481 RepID=A0A1G5HJC9_9BACT|nr:PAS domain S-box protein [Desulfoluna spongiiphila]SCY63781.1 PAS domain S-box-containing protein [Desulfoluna spongiiphila]